MENKHTSVIYFHGIGSPKRHSSLSMFLDEFDLFGQKQNKYEIGRPRDFRYKGEFGRDGSIISFVEFKRIVTVKNKPRPVRTVRVYEAYWVPEARSLYSIFYVIYWALLRFLNPLLLITPSWRSYPAVRLNMLMKLVGGTPNLKTPQALELLYRRFESWDNRLAYPQGTYVDFRSFVQCNLRGRELQDALKLLTKWKRELYFSAISSMANLIVILLIVLATLILIVSSLRNLLQYDSGSSLDVTFASCAGILIGTFVTIVAFYHRDYVFDVITWTMDAEREEGYATKERVVHYSRQLIRHVVGHNDCNRCVIVSHSLGTAIAIESILQEGQVAKIQYLENTKDSSGIASLSKIDFVITIGSPIDLIFNLFETDKSYSHRYHRLYEEQRRSLSLPPFWNVDRAGSARLINFWSRFDPISSPIASLQKRVSQRRESVENLEVVPTGAPFPIATHRSYFSEKSLMREIYWIVMSGRTSKEPSKSATIGRLASFLPILLWISLLIVLLTLVWLVVGWTSLYSILLPVVWCAAVGFFVTTWRRTTFR